VLTVIKRMPMAHPATNYQLLQPPDTDLVHAIGIVQFHEK